MTGSTRVTDEGILSFLGLDPSASAEECPNLNPVSRSLRFAKMRSTGVRVVGVRSLLTHAQHLQGLRCSTIDVLQALAIHLKGWSELKEEQKKENGR